MLNDLRSIHPKDRLNLAHRQAYKNMKDYYRTLGVLDDAEQIVIRAAYKALAQRYHPDKWTGSREESTKRMAEINEAYSVLSDTKKRKTYDQQRDQHAYTEDSDNDELSSSVEHDWTVVTEFFPDLREISHRLSRVSKSLASSFKLLMLEQKDFENRHQIADQLEQHYFEKYFGSNPQVIQFAKSLVLSKRIAVAKDLNNAISILGPNSNASLVISTLRKKHHLLNEEQEKQVDQAKRVLDIQNVDEGIEFIRCIGGIAKLDEPLFFGQNKIDVFMNKRYKTYTQKDFLVYVIDYAKLLLDKYGQR